MMRQTSLIAALLLSAASPLWAQGTEPFEFGGEVRLGFQNNDSDSIENTAFIEGSFDATLSFGGPIGVALSYATLELEDQDSSFDETWAWLYWDVGPGEIRIGRPRSAIEDVTPVGRDLAGTPAVLRDVLAIFRRPLLGAAVLSSDDPDVIGGSYVGDYGALSVGLSFHEANEQEIVAIAASYDFGEITGYVGLEEFLDLPPGVDADPNLFVGVEAGLGQVDLHVGYAETSIFFVGLSSWTLEAEWQATDRLQIAGSVLAFRDSSDEDVIVSLGARYDITDSLFVDLRAGGTTSGDGSAAEIAFGVSF